MKKFTAYALPLLMALTVMSCSKDKKDDVAPTKTSLLTAKSWRLTDTKVSGQSVYAVLIQPCQQDDLLKFNTNLVLTYSGGINKCDPNETATQTGSWAFLNNETQLRITDPSSEVFEGTIGTLNATTLIVSGNEDILGTGTPFPVELTFTAQ